MSQDLINLEDSGGGASPTSQAPAVAPPTAAPAAAKKPAVTGDGPNKDSINITPKPAAPKKDEGDIRLSGLGEGGKADFRNSSDDVRNIGYHTARAARQDQEISPLSS